MKEGFKTKMIVSSIVTLFVISPLMAQHAEELFQKGNALDWEGKYGEALEYVERSLNIDSTLYQRYHFRADLKVKLGMIDAAIYDLTKCINRCKCITYKYHVSDYYLDRALLQLKKGDDAAAHRDVDKSILINPENWKAYNFRSSLLIKSGNLKEALKDLNKSFQLNTNEATTLMSRGTLKLAMNDIQGACEDWSKVSNWGIDDYDVWLKKNCK